MRPGRKIPGREPAAWRGQRRASCVDSTPPTKKAIGMARTTLRDLMGLSGQPAPLRDTTLIMIDCQNTYRQGIMQLEGAEAALAEAARLLARARAAGIPIVHIMHDAGEGSPYDVHAEIGQISDEVAPLAGEAVIVKNFPNSFVGTDLDARLR